MTRPDSLTGKYEIADLDSGRYCLFIYKLWCKQWDSYLLLGLPLRDCSRKRILIQNDTTHAGLFNVGPNMGIDRSKAAMRIKREISNFYQSYINAKKYGTPEQELSFYSRQYRAGGMTYSELAKFIREPKSKQEEAIIDSIQWLVAIGDQQKMSTLLFIGSKSHTRFCYVLHELNRENGAWKIYRESFVLIPQLLARVAKGYGFRMLDSYGRIEFDVCGPLSNIRVKPGAAVQISEIRLLNHTRPLIRVETP